MALDHDARIAEHWVRADKIIGALSDLPNVEAKRHVEDNSLSNGVMLTLGGLDRTAGDVVQALKDGDPSIWARGNRDQVRIAVAHLVEDEIDIVIGRLRELLS